MAVGAGEGFVEPVVDDHGRLVVIHEQRAEAEDVAVVVLTGELGKLGIVNERRADAPELVCDDIDADAGVADQNAAVGLALGNQLRDAGGVDGVVVVLVDLERAGVDDLDILVLKHASNELLELEACVV